MTFVQKTHLLYALTGTGASAFHHGDCVGADEEFHTLVRLFFPTVPVLIHPPTVDTHRAFCEGGSILPAAPYLKRNRNIVDLSTWMIAVPGERTEQLRSGTWSTIRYARKEGKPMLIIYPNGEREYVRADDH